MGARVVRSIGIQIAVVKRWRRMALALLPTVVTCGACQRADDTPRTVQPTAPRPVETPRTIGPGGGNSQRVNSARGTYRIEFLTRPEAIPLNEPFEVTARVYDARMNVGVEGIELSVDAAMPEHGHGMNTQPVVSGPQQGTYTARGMLFHMPGRWELYFDIKQGGTTERATYVVELD